jgi:tetratricopeptide (TPR) repeat protein
LKANQSATYDFSESELNTLGYELLRMKKIKEAIEIFKLNVESFPRGYNTYDSLGEAYMINGDKELAIKNYKKSLELNPENTNAANAIKRLKNQLP